MNFFRYSKDAWGQETLQGISWDLFWIFLGIALVVISVHLIFDYIKKKNLTNNRPTF